MILLRPITYKDLVNVSWPLYVLPIGQLTYEDGLLTVNGKIIDNRNIPGDTLGKRRMHIERPCRLRRAVTDLSSIIESKATEFIDSRGNLIKYKKTVTATMRYKKIKRIETKVTGSLLWVFGEYLPIVVVRPPPAGYKWVVIVYLGPFPSCIYKFSYEKEPDFRKRL